MTWIWWILIRALGSLKSLHFHGLLLTKVYNVWAKKVQRSYAWCHFILIKHLKENWLVLSKMTWDIYQIALKSQNWDFDGILLSKVTNVSSNINEVIKTTLNSFIQKLHNHKKAQNAYKRTKIKMLLKKHLTGK